MAQPAARAAPAPAGASTCRDAACAVDGDADAAGAGGREPAHQRRQVHRARRARSTVTRRARAATRSCSRVRDTGIGIAPEHAAARLRPVRAGATQALDRAAGRARPRPDARAQPGRAARRHGRRRTATGRASGSEFIVRLPRWPRRAAPRGRRAGAAPPAAAPARRRRVLVVDDNVDAADAAGRGRCGRWATTSRVAHDGPAALRRWRELPARRRAARHRPAGDGRLRAGPPPARGRGVPGLRLVAVTGYGQDDDRQRAQRGRLRRPPGQAGGHGDWRTSSLRWRTPVRLSASPAEWRTEGRRRSIERRDLRALFGARRARTVPPACL